MADESGLKAQEVLENLLRHMGIEGTVELSEDDERITLDVQGEETSLVIGKKGQTLDSLQMLLSKMLGRGLGARADGPRGKPIVIDAEGYRQRRIDSLVAMAERLGEKAKESQRTVAVDAMNAHDRRIIHVTLDKVAGVRTHSEGEGMDRRLLIVPQPEEA